MAPGVSSVFRPFSWEAWLALVVSSFLMTLVLCAVLGRKCKFSRILENITSSLLGQSVTLKHRSEKWLMFPWLLGVTILLCCYLSVLLSALTVPWIYQVRDIPQLLKEVETGRYRVMSRMKELMGTFLESDSESLRKIGNSALSYSSNVDFMDFVTSEEPGIAYVDYSMIKTFLNNDFHVSDDYFMFSSDTFYVRKTFCCHEKLTRVIHRLTAAGIFEKPLADLAWKNKFLISSLMHSMPTVKPLTLNHLSGAFAILIGGHCIAFFTFVVEMVVKRCEGRSTNRNSKNDLNTSTKMRSVNRRSNPTKKKETSL